ncbi:caspase family protein ASCRUDRAFT_79615 [Ascoidea rubescens DSM 1968]|uniref:Metacaspase-1 n=1 Tax=Ascoidea rubescens DSM 1968 TaxID=1344418 RepID=A0A1D2VN41_9ASCO|nr:hypothetical protein ASCRUDRAFT_79615 [Ascoidea rubescens DSM 1968]ODV63031.1 hypothetical protein ASCRUDRAFT_79615 [Ascoidea rubescens DSM 1968]
MYDRYPGYPPNDSYGHYGGYQGPPQPGYGAYGAYGGYNGYNGYPPPQQEEGQYDGYGHNGYGYNNQAKRDIEYDFQEASDAETPDQSERAFDSNVDGYNYRYSDCSGNKKALLIGINYTGSKAQLNGCINDVQNVKEFLLRNGYSEENMVILTDDQSNPRAIPIKQNILDAMGWLVSGASPNDSLFFHFSGHGTQQEDTDGDEVDGYDEAIVPLDYEESGMIVDDVLHHTMVKPLPEGCRLTALFDCCHSGSALDLPYTYSTKGLLKEPNLAEEAGQGLLEAVQSYMAGDTTSAMRSIFGAVKVFMNGSNDEAHEKTKKTKTSPADVIMLSGCKDDQTSADASIGGEATGAMSYAFMKVMNSGKQQSYLSLLNNTRQILEGEYSQKPQLSASHPIDVSLKFSF